MSGCLRRMMKPVSPSSTTFDSTNAHAQNADAGETSSLKKCIKSENDTKKSCHGNFGESRRK